MRQVLVDYLINAAWQLPLLALGAFALARVASLTARQRCWLWSAFLILALVLPVKLSLALPFGAPAEATAAPVVAVAPVAAAEPVHSGLQIAPWLAEALIAGFALALTVGAIRVIAGLLAARRLVRDAEPFALSGAAADALARFASRHGFRAPAVRLSRQIASPVTVGAFSPVILVPAGFEDLPAEEARAALLHEAAHIQRDDFSANLFCELAALPLAWHPAIYPIKAGLRQARESAADELAARAMRSPELYAQCLVSLARAAGPQGRPTAALAMFGRGVLETRVKSLLALRPAGPLALARSLGAAVAVIAAVVAPALMLHVTPSFAQERAVGRAPQAAPQAAPLAASQLPPAAPRPAPIRSTDEQSVVINNGSGHIRHDWVAADGVKYTVFNGSTAEPSADEKRAYEAKTRASIAHAQKAIEHAQRSVDRAMRRTEAAVRATDAEVARTDAKVADIQREVAKIDMAEIARSVAHAQAVINDPKLIRQMAAAQAALGALRDGRIQRQLDRAQQNLKDGHYSRVIIGGDGDVRDLPDPETH
jgi:beta-lactamase regulating signal transducer with metallopeptidase domain